MAESGRRGTLNVVLKSVLNPKDWSAEISGYYHNRENPYVVNILALVLLSARECNQLCEGKKNFVERPEGTLVPTMVFEKWDGALDDAIEDGLVHEWGLITALDMLIHVCKATKVLHTKGSMHRDINPANILYRSVTPGVIMAALGDLGLSTYNVPETRHRTERKKRTLGCGTDGYIAPECKTGVYSHSADVFSLAVTVEQTIRAVYQTKNNTKMDPEIKDLIKRGKSWTQKGDQP